MGILDEAIREHLELKRQHGAAEGELRELEDEAFGPPARPGAQPDAALAEAPTTVAPAEPGTEDQPLEEPSSVGVEFAEGVDPQEQAPAADNGAEAFETQPPEAPEAAYEAPEPAEEEHPAIEQPIVGEGEGDPGTVAIETEEHPPPEPPAEPEPLAEPFDASSGEEPSELYDVGDEQAHEPEYEGDAPVEEEQVEDEFFSEQSLSDELDRALDGVETEAPQETEAPVEPQEPDEAAPEPQEPAEPPPEPHESGEEEGEDVLEETPEFLQDTPEHDRLWFEQKPPKDFDFDD